MTRLYDLGNSEDAAVYQALLRRRSRRVAKLLQSEDFKFFAEAMLENGANPCDIAEAIKILKQRMEERKSDDLS